MNTDAVTLVLDLMRKTFGEEFKTYYDGDPEVIPRVNLPAIIVTQLKDDTTEDQQGEDLVGDQIRIKVVLDKAADYTGSKIDPLNLTEKKIRTYIAAEKDGRYLDRSVKGAIRSVMLEGSIEAVAPTMTIEYGINPRQTMGNKDNAPLTAEGWATFAIEHSVETY